MKRIEDCLLKWVAWVRANLLKGRCFWMVKVPQNCSWCWRKILKMRDVAKKFLRFMVGDGTTIYLWLDCWHLDGVLVEKHGYPVVYNSGCKLEAKLSTVMIGKEWK